MFWCVSYCLVHLGQFRYCMKLGAKRAELVQLMQKFVPRSRVGIFTTNTPNPPHWTLNSSFIAFLSVWVHLGLFCYGSKLGAKWAELLLLTQKFMPWSHIRNIRNKWTNPHRWTKNSCFNAFLVFGCIWNHFFTAGNSARNGQNWCN